MTKSDLLNIPFNWGIKVQLFSLLKPDEAIHEKGTDTVFVGRHLYYSLAIHSSNPDTFDEAVKHSLYIAKSYVFRKIDAMAKSALDTSARDYLSLFLEHNILVGNAI
jgi:hypothetical protein